MHGRITCTAAAWLAAAALAFGQTPPPDIANAPTTSTCSDGGSCRTRGFYANVDYLLFDFRDGPAPALIQHVPTNQVFQSPLPDGAAITMYGDGIRHHAFDGLRAEVGYWVNDCWAGEVSYFKFETKNKRFDITSDGDPSIGRHYLDVSNSNNASTYLIFAQPADPNVVGSTRTSGFIDASSPLQLWGTEINARTQGYAVFTDHCDYIIGFRYVDLRDGIFISDGATFHDGSGLSIFGTDRFYATNRFYGGQVGFNSYGEIGCGFTVDVTGKLAIGGVEQQVAINGVTIQTVNGVVTQTTPGHVLTQPSNIGTYSRSRFAFVPELILKLGYQLGEHCNVSLGYDIFSITSVIRPGSAIDEGVNPNLSPVLIPNGNSTTQRPGFAFHGTDFWAQGLTLGFAVKY
jgi:Putative beta barrel porin-7 (BBP7)